MSEEINQKLLNVASNLEQLVTTMNIFVTRMSNTTNATSPILDSPVWHRMLQELIYIKKHVNNSSTKSDKINSHLGQISKRIYRLETQISEIKNHTRSIKKSTYNIDQDTNRIS